MKVSSVARSTSPNISPDSRDHFSILYHHGASRKEHTVEALAAAFFSISSKLTASDTVYGDRSLGAPVQLFGSNAATRRLHRGDHRRPRLDRGYAAGGAAGGADGELRGLSGPETGAGQQHDPDDGNPPVAPQWAAPGGEVR